MLDSRLCEQVNVTYTSGLSFENSAKSIEWMHLVIKVAVMKFFIFVFSMLCLVSCSGSSCDNSMTMRDVDDFERQITKIEQSVISREDLRAKILDFGYQYISKSNYDDLNWDRYTILCGSWFSEQRRFLQVGYDQDGLVVRVTTDIPR